MRKNLSYDVIIIGAGAAGLLAAGSAAGCGARVLVLEKMRQPGRKLLITGKGRCNITNDAPLPEFIDHIFPDGRFLRDAFNAFFSHDIISLLNRHGVDTVLERGGRIFPASNRSADVVNGLLRWVKEAGVEIYSGTKVLKPLISEGTIKGVSAEINGVQEVVSAHKVIICTGGKSYPATGSSGDGYRFAEMAGHKIVPLRPSLVPLVTEGNIAARLEGLSLKNVRASVLVNGKVSREDFGEMSFGFFGLTGPIILTLSRFIVDELRNQKKVEVSIDLKPALDEKKLDARLIRDLNENGKRLTDNLFRLWLPPKLIPVFLELLSLDPKKQGHQISSSERTAILKLLKDLRFRVTSVRSFKEAIITAGGVSTHEINPKTLESKLIKNLYFAGEILDLDADTGGYNLQIAWSTGWLAGMSAGTMNPFADAKKQYR